MYDHNRQYRCTIIRGKAKNEIDDLLPAYAKVINEICPCEADKFEEKFNQAFARFLPAELRTTLALESTKKTLANHRTEICGKLFSMYYTTKQGVVYESERTSKFLEDDDQPAFFKEMCYKMQFPNGMQKTNTVLERVRNQIHIRPNAFVLKLLQLAETEGIVLNVQKIGYYVLNALDVLRGNAIPDEVLTAIKTDIANGVERNISVPGKQSSYSWQHIREQLNYLELANLIIIDNGCCPAN